MELIEKYMLRSKEERTAHLRLQEPCIERGGPEKGGLSAYCKGLMAHVLDTSIPTGMKVHVCHACENAKCSNPNHLYWGSPKENYEDALASGRRKTLNEAIVAKYGSLKKNARL